MKRIPTSASLSESLQVQSGAISSSKRLLSSSYGVEAQNFHVMNCLHLHLHVHVRICVRGSTVSICSYRSTRKAMLEWACRKNGLQAFFKLTLCVRVHACVLVLCVSQHLCTNQYGSARMEFIGERPRKSCPPDSLCARALALVFCLCVFKGIGRQLRQCCWHRYHSGNGQNTRVQLTLRDSSCVCARAFVLSVCFHRCGPINKAVLEWVSWGRSQYALIQFADEDSLDNCLCECGPLCFWLRFSRSSIQAQRLSSSKFVESSHQPDDLSLRHFSLSSLRSLDSVGAKSPLLVLAKLALCGRVV